MVHSFIFFYIIEEESEHYKDNFYKGFILALCYLDANEMQDHWLLWFLLYVGAILNLAIMMNLLIGIVQNFSRVQEGAAIADANEKIDVMKEIEQLKCSLN